MFSFITRITSFLGDLSFANSVGQNEGDEDVYYRAIPWNTPQEKLLNDESNLYDMIGSREAEFMNLTEKVGFPSAYISLAPHKYIVRNGVQITS